MWKYFRPFCAIFVAICVFCLSSVAVLADDSSDPDDGKEYVQKASIFNWMANNLDNSSFWYGITGYHFGAFCPETEDSYHRASSYIKSGVSVLGATYYECTCDYCGAFFTAYESDLKQSYEAQVSEMPAPGYSSNGELRWRLTIDKFEPKDNNADVGSYVSGTSYSVSIRTERYL